MFRAGMQYLFEKIIENEQFLTKCDADVGDGDLGIGAARASNQCLKILNSLPLD